MGVEIKLTDREFPVTPTFIDFLHLFINEKPFDVTWTDQLSEVLVPPRGDAQRAAEGVAPEVLAHPVGQQAIFRSYQLLTAILTGVPERLRPFHERYRFICVVGAPRTGGTYLTKELYRAVGLDPGAVPNAIAHDGFPDAGPFDFREGANSETTLAQQMAEYLTMVEAFFSNTRLFNNRVVVPKKATKAAYQGGVFHAMLGPEAEYVVTVRHPVAACISTYEKSGGLPEDGRFRVRSNIEDWARRDAIATGEDVVGIFERDYFDVYLRYWEQYHYNLALTGLAANRNWNIIAYGAERLSGLVRDFFSRFRCGAETETFRESDYRGRHSLWQKKAEAAIERVAGVWRTVGRPFPMDQVMECR